MKNGEVTVKTLEVDAQNCEPYVYTNNLKIRTNHKLVLKKKHKQTTNKHISFAQQINRIGHKHTDVCIYVYVMYT